MLPPIMVAATTKRIHPRMAVFRCVALHLPARAARLRGCISRSSFRGGWALSRVMEGASQARLPRPMRGCLCQGVRPDPLMRVGLRRATVRPAPLREGTRIAPVPFTLRNLKEDLEDVGSNFDGAPDLEFRLATDALELEQSGLSYQRVPPGYRFPYGHTHEKQEEVYVVLHGSGRMKLDDKVIELKEWDAVRVPPGTWRGYEAGPDGLEIFVIGAPNLGDAPREDVEGQRDWWAD